MQPIRRRVLKVLHFWVKEDPWKEMEKSVGGGLRLFERIRAWTDQVEKELEEVTNTSPSVKSGLRQLKSELDRRGKDLRKVIKNIFFIFACDLLLDSLLPSFLPIDADDSLYSP